MMGSLDKPPIVLHGARRKYAVLLLGSAVFLAFALWDVLAQGDRTLGIEFSLIFFGLCGFVIALQIIFPARLEIGPAGLRQTVLFRSRRFAWADMENFRRGSGYLKRMVVFDFTNEYRQAAQLRRLNRAWAGAEGAFPPSMELGPAELAQLLTEAKRKWGAAQR